MSEESPFYCKLDLENCPPNGIGHVYVEINGQAGAAPICSLKNYLGRNYVPNPNVFYIDSPFMVRQIGFSLNVNASMIYIIGEIDNPASPMTDESIFIQNKCVAYMALYSVACAMYELHQSGLAFGHISHDNIAMDGTGQYVVFGYGFTNRDGMNKESIEKDNENFSKLVARYFPDLSNKNVTIEQIITTDLILDDIYFTQLEKARKLAKDRYKKLHFKNCDLIEISVKDAYPFLPPHYQNIPKSQADIMIKNLQVMYGGTPEEAFRANEEYSQHITQITQELMARPSRGPNPNQPYNLSYRKIVVSMHPFSNKGDFLECSASDLEGNTMRMMNHIVFKKWPPLYVPNENIYNIDFEPLNCFIGYYKFDGDLTLISNYQKFQNLIIVSPFEAKIRNEPVIASIFIIGIAAAVYFLHQKGICADGVNIKKILIDMNSFHPVLIEYGNPELMHKTMDDDEKELLDLCKDFFPHQFKNVEVPVSDRIIKGKIKLMESSDVDDYRTMLLTKIDELESVQVDFSQVSQKMETKNNEEESNEEEEKSDTNEKSEEVEFIEEKKSVEDIPQENDSMNEIEKSNGEEEDNTQENDSNNEIERSNEEEEIQQENDSNNEIERSNEEEEIQQENDSNNEIEKSHEEKEIPKENDSNNEIERTNNDKKEMQQKNKKVKSYKGEIEKSQVGKTSKKDNKSIKKGEKSQDNEKDETENKKTNDDDKKTSKNNKSKNGIKANTIKSTDKKKKTQNERKTTEKRQETKEKANEKQYQKDKIKNKKKDDDIYKPLNDLETIQIHIPKNLIQKNIIKKYGETYNYFKSNFSSNDALFLNQETDNMIEALMNIRHSKMPTYDLVDRLSSSRQCEGTIANIQLGMFLSVNLLNLLRYSGVNGIREIDEFYSIYNVYSNDIPISVAFQLLLDFSPHMSPPESTLTFNTLELIEYAKRGDCGALYRLGKLMNENDLIRKASEWNYPPAMYEIGRIDKNKALIKKAAKNDYPLAKAYIEYGNFEGTDEELVNKYINDFPDSEVTAEFYLYGTYVDTNEKKAVKILIENNIYFKLGMYYLFYNEIRFSDAYEAFKNGFEVNSDPRCRFGQIILDVYINEIYYDDLKQDMTELAQNGLLQAKFFIGERKEAAEGGLRTAMFEYGRDFYLGENGQPMCAAKGYPYMMSAHRLGHPYAYQLLEISGLDPLIINIDEDLSHYNDKQLIKFSKILYEGKYADRDYEKSYNCIKLAADHGYEPALYMKAYYLQYGIGIQSNINEALNIFENINSNDSLCQQAIIHIVEKKENKNGYSKLSQAINNGSAKAAFILGMLKNDNQGIECLKLAAQHGVIDAEFFLDYLHPSEKQDNELKLYKQTLKLAQNGYPIAIIALHALVSKNGDIRYEGYSDLNFIEKRAYFKKYLNMKTVFQGLGNMFPGFYDKDIFEYPTTIQGIPLNNMVILLKDAPKNYIQIFYVMSELDNPACLTYKANHTLFYCQSILPLQKCVYYYKKASKLGDYTADLQLSNCYYRGIILYQDLNKAIYFAQKASKSGISFANDFLQYISEQKNQNPKQFDVSELGYKEMLISKWIEPKNKHIQVNKKNDQNDETSESSLSINTSSSKSSGMKRRNINISLDDDNELANLNDNELDQNQLIRNALESKSRDINNTDSIFEYGSALFYGDYGFEKDREAAKNQFMRIRSNGPAAFMLRTKYEAPIKPIYRKRMTKKEEQFLVSNSLDPNDYSENDKSCGCMTCCTCCKGKDKSEDEDDEKIITKVIDFGQIIKSVWPIISVVLSIIKIFQGASISTHNKSISFNSTINKIVDWSIKLVRNIIEWTQVENISSKQTGMLMAFLVLFGFAFPLCSLKRSAPIFILCLISSLIFAPLGIGIAMKKWILFGVFLCYYIIIWPFVWWISKAIKDKKIWNACMIIFYIPQTIVGFAYVCFYILIRKPNYGIVQALMPYLRFLPIAKIEDFFSQDYQYYNLLFGIESDSVLNACFSWGISWILFNVLLYWILGLCPVFYFVLSLTIVIYIITLIVLIRGIYFVKYTMQFLSFFAIFIYEKLLELLLMPAVDLVFGDEGSMLSNITKSTIIILSIIFPFAFISLISFAVYHQSRTYHPAMYYGFLATTISVDGVCDGFKMKYSFWPIIDNLYQITFAILTIFTSPIVPCIFAFVYFVVIWAVRPNILTTDNIIIAGEPFALCIFNLIVFINKSKTVPLWAGILLIILAILPALICIIWYYAKQRGHEFEKMIQDMQYEVDARKNKNKGTLELIDVNHTWKIMKQSAVKEQSTFLFMKHFTLIKPSEIDEDDFPEPKFIQKIIDIRSSFFIDVLCSFSLTFGAFLFYLQIGEKVNIH